MKLLLLNVGLAVCLVSGTLKAGEPGAKGALRNGDVNCSGVVDLSDAVYILNWLFLGSERPCPLADPPQLLEQIAALEAEVRASREELEATQAMLAATQAELGRTQKELAEAQAQLASCSAGKEECEAGLGEAQAALAGCEADLSETEEALATAEERVAELEVPGCMNPEADKYEPCANVEDGSCEFLGCTDPEAENYDPRANVDDGGCCYSRILFSERFDGPDLPETLTYLESADWTMDDSNRLEAGKGGRALSKPPFSLSDGRILRCSAEMGKPAGASPSYATVLILAEYWVAFHPGFTGGAFRLERREDRNLLEVLIDNQDMGFTPLRGELHHVEALFARQEGGMSIKVSITGMGTDSLIHTYELSYLDADSRFANVRIGVGAGGAAFFGNISAVEMTCDRTP